MARRPALKPVAAGAHGAPDPAARALGREVESLRREVALLKARLAEAEALADADVLAPVLNRRAFIRELKRVVAFVERYGGPASLIIFDLDGFKAVNDRFGHAAGDAALTAVADRLTANVRSSDLVGRLGGDEFAVVLAMTDAEAGAAKAAALALAVGAEPVTFEGVRIELRASWGLSEIAASLSADQILARADAAMFASKQHPL